MKMSGEAHNNPGDSADPDPGIPQAAPWTPRSSRRPTPAEMRAYVRGHIRDERPSLRSALLTDARHFRANRGERFEFHSRIGRWLDALHLLWAADAYPGVVLYRIQTRLSDAHVPILPKLLHRLAALFFDIDIEDCVLIGEGLYLPHGKVCIAGVLTIGRGAIICPWTTVGLGQGSMLGPVIGDHVFIGTGAKILGALTIGDGAIIGANSVVTGDVAPNTTVAGVPARVIARAADGPPSAADGAP